MIKNYCLKKLNLDSKMINFENFNFRKIKKIKNFNKLIKMFCTL